MKRPFKYVATALTPTLQANCAGYSYNNSSTTGNSPENDIIRHNIRSMLGILCLLIIWLSYRIRLNIKRRKKPLALDEQEVAMLHLSVDTLGDLVYRLKQKARSKIIPFPGRS